MINLELNEKVNKVFLNSLRHTVLYKKNMKFLIKIKHVL